MLKSLLMICAALVFAYLLALGLLLLIGHQGGVFLVLLALGLFAIGLTLWLLRSEPPQPPASR
jgi:hypothetical protein